MAKTGHGLPELVSNASRQGTAPGDPTEGGGRDHVIPCGAGTEKPFAGEGRDVFVVGDGDISGGDSADGGSGRGDQGRLDLLGNDWAGGRIGCIGGDRNTGLVTLHDRSGAVPGAMSLAEIEHLIPCFSAGTLIETPEGPRPVASLRPGDPVLTLDDGPQPVRRIARRAVGLADLLADPGLQPVEIPPGALGLGLPERAIRVSPQHRVLFGGAVCELLFGAEEVLVPAIQLLGWRNVRQRMQALTYVQIMFDRHQIVRTQGLWLESHQPSRHGIAGIPDAQCAQMLRLFPEREGAGSCPAARMTLMDYETRVLLAS
jgi:hypothetical protein